MAKKRRSHGQGTLFKRNGRGPWIASWYDHTGKRKERSTRTTDKAAAERILNKRVADTALRREGVIDPREDGYATADRRPLSEHLNDFRRDLEARDNTPAHCAETHRQAKRVIELARADRISDLKPAVIQEAVKQIERDGASYRTCNKAITAIKAFSKWLKRERRTRDYALQTVESYNAAEDVRHQRRDLTDDELSQLIETTATRDIEGGMKGLDRAMLYLIAASTGYRRNELRSLTPESFDLDAQPPTIAVAASYTKAGREDIQPIRCDLAERLRPWLASKRINVQVFAQMPMNTARTLRWDLKAAGIAYSVDGKKYDFHALRGSYISRVERAGASIKVLQALARHTDPTLTLKRYVRLRLHDQVSIVESLPSFTPKRPGSEAMRATGTNDLHANPQQYPQQLGRETPRVGTRQCDNSYQPGINNKLDKPLRMAVLSDDARCGAKRSWKYPLGESNPCSRTENPMTQIVSSSNTGVCDTGATAPSSTPSNLGQNTAKDTELQQVIDAWPALPEAVKAGIVAMIEATQSRGNP